MAKYNGWTNYETWAVALWIDNEESSYKEWRAVARQAKKTEGKRWAVAVAEDLKAGFSDGAPPLPGVYGDLLGAALSEVNWFEIAKDLLR